MKLEGQVRIPSGCAISAVISREGRRMTGEDIIRSMVPMHDRSNGLGGGFAAYGIYPEHREEYAFHIFFDDNTTRRECEAMLKEGFDDTLEDTNLNVVYEVNCDGWTAELAVGYMEEALEKYPHVKGIMCGNDDIASQVVQVLAENQLAGNVMVVGQDGDLAACQRIVEGTQYMTAFKSIEDQAKEASKYVVEIGSGKEASELEGVTEKVNDGTYDIPARVLEPTAVTRENIDEVIIDGGFHRRDEVYLNAEYN